MLIYVLRHGITQWNKLKKVQGAMDIPLAPEGIELADDLPLFILKPASFKNSEINFLDSFILNNRNLPVSQHIMCCLSRSCQRTGKTDIKLQYQSA